LRGTVSVLCCFASLTAKSFATFARKTENGFVAERIVS
jgi:hypothetical protein